MAPVVHISFAIIMGAIIGSFLNVVIQRLPPLLAWQWKEACHQTLNPEQQVKTAAPPDLIRPRSQCPHCQEPIRFYDNIPLLSWMILKGHCRHCDHPISLRYPTVEVITALVWGFVVWKLGMGGPAISICLLSAFLIPLAAIDLEHQVLPDGLTLGLLWVGLLINGSTGWFASPVEAIWGAALGYAILWSIYQIFFLLTGKEGLGFGDFKLLAALGAWVGWSLLPFILFVASILGTVFALLSMVKNNTGRDVPIAFGPYLALAGWIAILWGQSFMDWLFWTA